MNNKLLENYIRKIINEEQNAYQRGSDQNLKKSILKMAEFLTAWSKQIDKQQMENEDFDLLINECQSLIKTLQLHQKNWK